MYSLLNVYEAAAESTCSWRLYQLRTDEYFQRNKNLREHSLSLRKSKQFINLEAFEEEKNVDIYSKVINRKLK